MWSLVEARRRDSLGIPMLCEHVLFGHAHVHPAQNFPPGLSYIKELCCLFPEPSHLLAVTLDEAPDTLLRDPILPCQGSECITLFMPPDNLRISLGLCQVAIPDDGR